MINLQLGIRTKILWVDSVRVDDHIENPEISLAGRRKECEDFNQVKPQLLNPWTNYYSEVLKQSREKSCTRKKCPCKYWREQKCRDVQNLRNCFFLK